MATHSHNASATRTDSELEYGDVHDLRRLFRLRETAIYELFRKGKISGVLLRRDKHSLRGKRLFNIASVRSYLASQEATGQKAPKADTGLRMVEARRQAKKAAAAK
jgi:hypothetical protein